MLVLDAMTARPVTVSPEATVAAAVSAMRRGRFRHLPVVAGTELVGVVSERDLETWPGAGVEVAESLAERPVAEVMTSQPVTVWPDEPVEVAARLLVDNAIGCLPVVAEEGLVGILTVSDLFSVLLRLLGGGEPSSRITLVVPDVPGALGRAMKGVGELGVNLLTVVTEPGPEPGTRGVVLRAGTINAAPVVAALVAAGFPATGPAARAGRRERRPAGSPPTRRLAAYDFWSRPPVPGRPGWTRLSLCGRPMSWTTTPAGLRPAATPTWS